MKAMWRVCFAASRVFLPFALLSNTRWREKSLWGRGQLLTLEKICCHSKSFSLLGLVGCVRPIKASLSSALISRDPEGAVACGYWVWSPHRLRKATSVSSLLLRLCDPKDSGHWRCGFGNAHSSSSLLYDWTARLSISSVQPKDSSNLELCSESWWEIANQHQLLLSFHA